MADNTLRNILIGAAVVWLVMGGGLNLGGTGVQTSPSSTSGTVPYISTGATTLSLVPTDALQPGTSLSASISISNSSVGVNGGELNTGISTASPKEKLEILMNTRNIGYHPAYIASIEVPQSPTFSIEQKFKANGSVTISAFNTDGVAITTLVNQTVASGGAYTMKVRMDGSDKKDTQDMRCVLETNSSTKMDKAILNGFGATYVGMAKPSFYTLSDTASQIWVYDIQPIVGAASPEGSIYVASKTSQSLAGTKLIFTCYTKEYFIDPISGDVSYAIEDSQGTAKWMATYTKTIVFQ